MPGQPRLHGFTETDLNPEALDDLLGVARRRGVLVTEPFAGLQRFDGALTVLGPTQAYYEELLKEQLMSRSLAAVLASLYRRALTQTRRVLAALPPETLDDTGETTPRNNTSVITQLAVDGRRLLFTGDAGIPALHAALDYAELFNLTSTPLDLVDVPHHGSRRNLGPTILDRLLRGQAGVTAVVSASDSDPKHPSPKVTNALMRRGCEVYTTEDGQKWYPSRDAPARGWGAAQPVPPLDEADDED